jgi:hypothetical protein
MKSTTTLMILLATLAISSCQTKPKTPEEIYQESMKGKTDDQLIEELYGHPQNYTVSYVNVLPEYRSQPEFQLQVGGVLQVMFNKDKIYIEGLGSLSGSYASEYYANPLGTVNVKFTTSRSWSIGNAEPYKGHRNPQEKSDYLSIHIYDDSRRVIANYDLHRMK